MMPRLLLIVLVSSVCSTVNASELGRLFTSPQERKLLDDIRRGSNIETIKDVAPLPLEIRQSLPSTMMLSGLLQKQNGQYVIWVNGASDLSSKDVPVDRLHILKDTPNITLHANQQSATLKPGQVWRLDENVIIEGYLSGRELAPVP